MFRVISLDRSEEVKKQENQELGVNSLLNKVFEPTVRNCRCHLGPHEWVIATPSLAQLPATLILHIKRFKSTSASPVKVNTPIAVPTELDLSHFCTTQTSNAPTNDHGEPVNSIEGSEPKNRGRRRKRKSNEDIDLGGVKRARGSHRTFFRAGAKAGGNGPTGVGIVEDRVKCSVCTLLKKRGSLTCEVFGSRTPREDPLSARYKLRSIIHHLGKSAERGHYVTDVREVGEAGAEMRPGSKVEASGDSWKRYDDSNVYPVFEAKALKGDARRSCYICFYTLADE